ncbi:hypothetical protein G6F40_014342 [Rhizopus arrhizus]|nr:hypothetical protein G6F40_014342 [Rhizopus arrhizus]
MKQHRIARAGHVAATLGLILGIGLLAACRSHAPAADGPAEATAVHFPEASNASRKEGAYPDVADLRRFAPGMSKRQLYTLLGTPHFNEGMWGVRALRRQGHCPGRVLEAGIVRGRARPTAAAGTAGTATGAIAGTTVAAVCRRTVRLRQCEAQRRRPAGGAGHPGAGA